MRQPQINRSPSKTKKHPFYIKRLIVNFLLRLLIFTKKLKGKTDLKKYTYSDHAKLDPNA